MRRCRSIQEDAADLPKHNPQTEAFGPTLQLRCPGAKPGSTPVSDAASAFIDRLLLGDREIGAEWWKGGSRLCAATAKVKMDRGRFYPNGSRP
jgi:hypothetical protein